VTVQKVRRCKCNCCIVGCFFGFLLLLIYQWLHPCAGRVFTQALVSTVFYYLLQYDIVAIIRGYFYNEMRYINLRFTYLLTYQWWLYMYIPGISTASMLIKGVKHTEPINTGMSVEISNNCFQFVILIFFFYKMYPTRNCTTVIGIEPSLCWISYLNIITFLLCGDNCRININWNYY